MLAFVLRRLAQAFFVIAAMLVIVFFGVNVVGDPIYMLISPEMDQQQIAETARALGLDRPIWEQFLIFLKNAVQGDLGRSFVHGESAIKLILHRMPATLELAFVALFMAIVIGLPLGLYAGLKPNSMGSKVIMTGSILGFSLPSFWQGMMLVMIFSVWLGWLPSSGRGPTGQILGIETSFASWEGIRHLILPATNLALFKLALVIRLTRTGVRETMPLDFVKFARAKGLSSGRIVGVHVMKNIMLPVVTVLGLELGAVIAFAVVTESIFNWPGMGKLIIDSIQRLDRPVVVAYLMVTVAIVIFINLVVDVVYSLLDPRIRLKDLDR